MSLSPRLWGNASFASFYLAQWLECVGKEGTYAFHFSSAISPQCLCGQQSPFPKVVPIFPWLFNILACSGFYQWVEACQDMWELGL